MNLKPLLFRTFIILFSGTVIFSSCSDDEKEDDQASTTLENEVLSLINTHRSGLSLPSLVKADVIVSEARKHSENMADGSVPYGHDGLTDRLNVIYTSVPWSESAENVGAGTGTAADIVNAWLASSAHKSNIEYSGYTRTGVGVAKASNGTYYYTQIFIKPE